MKILIDIGHPAHVHYFRNFIKIMGEKGHKFLITSRNKEIEHYLLNTYNIPFVDRGKGEKSILGKIMYLLKADGLLLKQAKKFNPNLLLSFNSVYLSHVSKLLNIPHIAFDDTEHANLTHLMSLPFTKTILTPSCYNKDLAKKQIRFNGYMELCYLHQKYFKPYPSILDLLKVKKDEKYIILRFVSWNAFHDIGQTGLTLGMKHKIVKELSKYAQVFISSEGELPDDLKKYQIKIPPERMHDALAFATLFLGEGATMASECAMLGTTAIYVNSLNAGTLEEQEKYGLLFSFRNSKGVLEKAIELLNTPNLKQKFQKRRQKMLSDKIDVTAFMIWFIENYPESVKIMKDHPDYQNRFKSQKTSA
jgi:predicted glycosyltransferase